MLVQTAFPTSFLSRQTITFAIAVTIISFILLLAHLQRYQCKQCKFSRVMRTSDLGLLNSMATNSNQQSCRHHVKSEIDRQLDHGYVICVFRIFPCAAVFWTSYCWHLYRESICISSRVRSLKVWNESINSSVFQTAYSSCKRSSAERGQPVCILLWNTPWIVFCSEAYLERRMGSSNVDSTGTVRCLVVNGTIA